MRRIILFLLIMALSGVWVQAGVLPDNKSNCSNNYSHDPGDDISLTCEAILHSFYVPSINGYIYFDLVIINNGDEATPVYAELYPTIGNPRTGIPFDFNINRLVTPNLVPDDTIIGYYYFHVVNVRALSLDTCCLRFYVGRAIDDWAT